MHFPHCILLAIMGALIGARPTFRGSVEHDPDQVFKPPEHLGMDYFTYCWSHVAVLDHLYPVLDGGASNLSQWKFIT